jgi:low temperature requirement protein LtrA
VTAKAEAPRNLLRERTGKHARVGFAELFFDLVFVFAVTQLSHSLLGHMSLLGFVQTGALFLAVWWTWVYTAWATNWLNPETVAVRVMLFALMAAGLMLSISLTRAFDDRGAVFAIAFVTMQVGRGAFVALAMRRPAPDNARNFVRITSWSVASGVFFLWGAFGDPSMQLPLWGIALAIEYVAPSLGFRVPGLGYSRAEDWDVEGAHFAERCGLFIIIALGESVLITGATFAQTAWTPPEIAGFLSAFVGTIAMWWIYFNLGAERASEEIEHAHDPGRHARLGYTYLHIPIVAGIVVTAASDELVLAHPLGHTEPLVAACLVGGPALYLLGNALFKRVTARFVPLSHLIGLGLLAALAVGSLWLSPLLLSIGGTLVMIFVAAWETLSLGSAVAGGPEVG